MEKLRKASYGAGLPAGAGENEVMRSAIRTERLSQENGFPPVSEGFSKDKDRYPGFTSLQYSLGVNREVLQKELTVITTLVTGSLLAQHLLFDDIGY